MSKTTLLVTLVDALAKAIEHLEYCNYGDKWENECAKAVKLPERLQQALEAGQKELRG